MPPNRNLQSQKRNLSSIHRTGRIDLLSVTSLKEDERNLARRKMNVASFGFGWIKPAGCLKTMAGRREEELEKEEAAQAELQAEEARQRELMEMDEEGQMEDGEGMGEERDLDDEVPDADAMAEEDEDEEDDDGFVEGGDLDEDGLLDVEEEDLEQEMFERDLDEFIPEGMENEYDDLEEEASQLDMGMDRNLDDSIVEMPAVEEEDEWQHTDTDEETEDESSLVRGDGPASTPNLWRR